MSGVSTSAGLAQRRLRARVASPRGISKLDDATRALMAALRGRLRRRFGDRLKGLILFGSRARGDHTADSDADVAIVLAGPIALVKNGPLETAHGRDLNKALEIRNEGDYDLEPPDRDDVVTTVGNAAALVDAVAALIERPEG